MFSTRFGRAPRPIRLGVASAALIGLIAVLGGCANERGAATSTSSTAAPMNMAGVRVEIEADGLPAQLAPRNHAPVPAADDPREPWSPNYGTVRPARTVEAAPQPVIRTPPAAAIPVRYAQPVDAEDIIRRAVAAHEMRQGDQ